MSEKWFSRSYRRNLIDMHIPDWNEKFMSEFDPEKYVEMLSLSGVDTALIYSSSCLGNCYWPTVAGHMHEGLHGRDIIKEITELCIQKNINAVVYFNIWSRWAYINHPDWRMIDVRGRGTLEYLMNPGRYGCCCPNSDYRGFVEDQIKDLCSHYDFKGLWIDMIGWNSVVCYCSSCRKKYIEETGREIPVIVDWEDPEWVMFQRKREEWMAGFAENINKTARSIRPGISIVHQCASWPQGWLGGVNDKFLSCSDYLAGDFYVDATEQSYFCKMLNSTTNNKPIEFMTSRCPSLLEHTTSKPKEELLVQVLSSIANNSSFLFIDAIDPIGTINMDIYETMGELFAGSKKYEKYLGSENVLCSDAAIYFNLESGINYEDNGKRIDEVKTEIPMYRSLYNISKTMINANMSFDIISKKNLDSLKDHQVVILPDLAVISRDEAEAFRQYVKDGGSIYASRRTSILDTDGSGYGDFLLSDLFAVSYIGETKEKTTYIRPHEDAKNEFTNYSERYPLAVSGAMAVTVPSVNASVLAGITLPYYDPCDTGCFSSAISDPPGIDTDHPAIVFNRYGRGKVIYSAGTLERMESDNHRNIFIKLIKRLFSKQELFKTNAPKPVEITMFWQKENKRYVINVMNYQKELPNIPVYGIKLGVNINGKQPKKIINISDGSRVSFIENDQYIEFDVPKLESLIMFVLEYE